jgi:hypothetical protein
LESNEATNLAVVALAKHVVGDLNLIWIKYQLLKGAIRVSALDPVAIRVSALDPVAIRVSSLELVTIATTPDTGTGGTTVRTFVNPVPSSRRLGAPIGPHGTAAVGGSSRGGPHVRRVPI